MDTILGTQTNFRSLSIKDLLEARDTYHFHLMNKANVVGTAIGSSTKLKAVATDRLIALYTDEAFVQSLDLDHIGPVL